MAIQSMEGVANPLIIKWIRKFSKILYEKLKQTTFAKNLRNVEILELDELFSYCKKKLTKCIYGLLLIDSEIKLLTLK